LTPDTIRAGLGTYTGVDRRFQMKGQERGITVFDDYGHHPTEIRATLAAARDCRFGRVHAIFQPHRYTRTMHLMDDFARSFHEADRVYLLDIYAASEMPIDGVTSQQLAQRMSAFGHRFVQYCGTIEGAVKAVQTDLQAGDAVLTLGAGNVWQAGDQLLAALRANS
ncbi:MAG: cyanophycin synthetase, partial [Bryobacteraceae bacterium]